MPTSQRTHIPRVAPGVQRFGAHLSIAGGVHNALVAAQRVGGDCLQIFVKNQQQWTAPPLDSVDIVRWTEARRATSIRPIVAHATYLFNLASPDDALWHRSVEAFADEIRRCRALGIRDIVVHPGSHRGSGLVAGLGRVVEAIDTVCEATPDANVRILLETTAGQGDSVGHRFEHLGEILHRTRHPHRLGVCLDTCHVFAAGYDLRSPPTYEATMAQFRKHVGMRRLRCIHVNDSKTPLGSNVDRHEHIARGHLGLSAFQLLVNDERLARVPKILETPKGLDDRGREWDRVNLARLRRLIRRR
jgi:deoxyribonuclease-4